MTKPIPPQQDKPGGWRGSAALWLSAAREALVETGIEAVKIQPLAQRLGLSRTSFYWFFPDREALLDALLTDWEATNTAHLVQACDSTASTITEAVLGVIGVFLDERAFEPRLDLAVRGWAHGTAAVAARVHAADAARLDAIRGLFLRFGYPPGEADVRARTVYLVQIGYIAMQLHETRAERMARIPDYVKTYTGTAPDPAELARFHARFADSAPMR